ncbi:MAG: response regulator transcription factor [Gemmatimonadaceae bacterium]|nr:response regulator transcription factor [Gemmatimonadaceae bacterium]
MPARRWRLVLADDHHLVLDALRTSLADRYDVVGVAQHARGILDEVERHHPDLLLLDLSLPERNGLELIPELRERSPRTRILVVTMMADRVIADRAIAAGASGFVPKDAGLAELELAITAVMRGGTFISDHVPQLSNRVSLVASHPALAALSPRQHEIILLITEGLTSAEIARKLGLTERTVGWHRTNIREKLGVDSPNGLVRFAVLLQPDRAGGEGA